jgi:hypothetical protein
MSGRALIGLATLLLLGVAPATAAVSEPPVYDGTMGFGTIDGPSDPEEFTWRVELAEGQVLEQVDERNAGVYYTDVEHHPAFAITAVGAHDADGRAVPTTLVVTEPDLITLLVHHRDGVPATGEPFDYPITPGSGWTVTEQGGNVPPEVVVRPVESSPNPGSFEQFPQIDSGCRVPRLRGRTLRPSKRLLRSSGCRVGAVRKRSSARMRSARVVRQFPRPGTKLAGGSTVAVTLAG